MTDQPEQQGPPRLYLPEEVAEIMHVSVALAKRRMSSGRWPSTQPGRTRMMTAAMVQQVIDMTSTPAYPAPAPSAAGLSPRTRHRRAG